MRKNGERPIHGFLPFAFTIAALVFVTGIKVILEKVFHFDTPLTLYYSVVILSAIYGGPIQGVIASILSFTVSYFLFMNGENLFYGPHLYGSRLVSFAFDTGIVVFLVSILQTSRKKAEHSLRETQDLQDAADHLKQSQDFLDSVVENIPNMLFVKDARNLRFVRFNRAGERLVGQPREVLIGRNDFDFFPKEQAEVFMRADRAVLDSGQVVDIAEEQLATKDGIRFLHTRKIPLLDHEGRPAYLLGISEDITQKKEAEQHRLKLAQEQAARAEIERIADQMRFLSEASAALNESLNLKSCLDAFAKILISHLGDWCEIVLIEENELKIQEVVVAHADPGQKSRADEFRNRHSMDWEQPFGVAKVILTGKPELYSSMTPELFDKIKDPVRREAISDFGIHSAMIVPLQSYGRVIGALSISSAESKRSYTEYDLSLTLDLAKRASFAIENSRLFKKAQEANMAKSAFLANMSHEIRTPLGAMLGFAALLSDEKLETRQRDYVATLLRNGEQLLRIVDEILDLSKVESDRIQIESVEFVLPSLLREVASLLKLQAAEKSLRFTLNGIESLPKKIVSDPTRIRQILINVIGNAIKFTHRGGVDVGVSMRAPPDATAPSVLEIRVHDSGIGISSEQRSKLFQPFSQADNSTSRKYGGTGLGLFLARRLARMMSGDVELIASEFEKGSEFLITLSVQECAQTNNIQEQISIVQETRHHEGRILVVDDAPDNRMLMQLFLSRLGYMADVAESGKEAVHKAVSLPFDLILMDVQMPEMDGFEAVAKLRERGLTTPIVALTAHTMKGDRERCLAGGFDDFLGKPIDRELLKQCLEKHIHHSPAAGAEADSSVHV